METSFVTVKELESPIKLTSFLYLKDLLIMVVYVMVMYQLKIFVYSALKIPYAIFCIIWAIYFILPSTHNHTRRNWQNIIITIISLKSKRRFEPIKKEFKDYTSPIGE